MSVSTPPLLSDKSYNLLKYTVTVILPAFAALYLSLGQIWGFGHVEAVVGTVTALNVFAGALLHLTTAAYNKSQDGSTDGSYADLVVDDDGPWLSFNGDPAHLDTLKKVTLNVVNARK
jgi:hypothetical protein